jgi:hypothetical protein
MCRPRPHALTACYQIATEMKGPGLLGKNGPAVPETVYKAVVAN